MKPGSHTHLHVIDCMRVTWTIKDTGTLYLPMNVHLQLSIVDQFASEVSDFLGVKPLQIFQSLFGESPKMEGITYNHHCFNSLGIMYS